MQYPTFDLEQLQNLIRVIDNAESDPEYLDPSVCPYDAGVRDSLQKLLGSRHPVAKATLESDKAPVGRPRKDPVLPINEVEKEVDEIRKEIAQLKIDAKGLETADRIQIIKTRATLVEKIIGMKERIHNIKKQQQFISQVIGLMEDIMEQSQREEMIKKLAPFLEE